ncbi:glycerophosphoryl diester phosphodiesterase [Geomonas silvestris]|uniref:Glycerophosphoryl diester phosphodiesterase n=1 Tax=Geomonas silvestris TaxID=2740184 RepID=A0A6V8MLF9_9BACT|nr:glycerophosphodiester phosphodiesterase [Geomonas silvestris]GFO60764.1 glycerophosphoryl diester phosphodiesterase [Geomonas silvestris]
MSQKTLIIGHRGSPREAPENTLGSFRLAFAEGADGIETDFRLSKDGEIVCLHDERTARTADADLVVARSSFGELRHLDAGAWKGERWRGERIPSLAEVLEEIPAGKLFFIEIKCGTEILPRLENTLLGSGFPADKVRILAFSAELIRAVKERLPGYRACWLTDYRFRGSWHPEPRQVLETLRACRADGLASRERSVLDREFVAELRREGEEIHVWTVDRVRQARRLLELGVDSIMTNRPGWLRQNLDR